MDSRQDLANSANQLVEERGGRSLSLEAVTAMVGEGAALLVRRALSAAGVPEPDDPRALRRFLEIYDDRLLETTALYPGVLDALEAARAGGRVAILTNKPLHHTERLLEGLGLRQAFDEVIGGDSHHGRKPAPDGLRALMRAAGVSGDSALMVGDSLVDLETAEAASAACCLVTFGFGFARIPADRIPQRTLVARDGRELTALVAGFVAAGASGV